MPKKSHFAQVRYARYEISIKCYRHVNGNWFLYCVSLFNISICIGWSSM